MNPLIIYLQPKDIPEVLEPLKDIPCDKAYLKYFPYPHVYAAAAYVISSHPEYDFIIWLQNDIVFTRKDYDKLCISMFDNDFDILGASMNVDLSFEGWEKCAFCVEDVDYSSRLNMPYADRGDQDGIIKVTHNGGVFICKREILIKHPLTGKLPGGFNADLIFGIELRGANIQYFLNSDIHLMHLRHCGDLQVNKKQASIEFVKN